MKEINKLQLKSNPAVKKVIDQYPEWARKNILDLRRLILETAEEIEQISGLEETLKWGEPSYITKIGSTLRIAFSEKRSDQYGMYFQCNSRLVSTFKLLFGDRFSYEGKRAILFKENESIPKEELKQCIKAALCYHQVKKLPTLGI